MQRMATLEIPQDILESAHMSLAKIKLELALHLYERGKLSSGKARELAGFSLWQFRQVLALRRMMANAKSVLRTQW